MARRAAAWLMAAGTAACACVAGCNPSPNAPEVGLALPGNAFNWTVTPGDEGLTVQAGAAGTFTIRLDSKENINSEVSLSVSGSIPPNSTATFVPPRLASTGRNAGLTIQTTAQTPLGSYPLTITATEVGYNPHVARVLLDVVSGGGAADFLLEVDPADITLTSGNGPTIAFRIRPINGFAGTVSIFVDGIEVPPAPVTISTPPTPAQLTFASGDPSQGGTFVPGLAQRPSYPPTWTLIVRAVSGSIVHMRTLNITISPR